MFLQIYSNHFVISSLLLVKVKSTKTCNLRKNNFKLTAMNTIQIISIFLAILCAGLILFFGVKTDLLREKSTDAETQGCYSFSRFQFWLWTLIICPVFVLFWGFSGDNPDINVTALILLGIPASVTVTSSVVANTHEEVLRKDQPTGDLELKRYREGRSFWTDLLTDDKGQFSIARLQNLIFTFVFVVIYVSMFFGSKMSAFPDFENNTFILMGISSSGYVLGKAMKR